MCGRRRSHQQQVVCMTIASGRHQRMRGRRRATSARTREEWRLQEEVMPPASTKLAIVGRHPGRLSHARQPPGAATDVTLCQEGGRLANCCRDVVVIHLPAKLHVLPSSTLSLACTTRLAAFGYAAEATMRAPTLVGHRDAGRDLAAANGRPPSATSSSTTTTSQPTYATTSTPTLSRPAPAVVARTMRRNVSRDDQATSAPTSTTSRRRAAAVAHHVAMSAHQ